MMKKRFPPPPEVVQRARCCLALRLLRAYVDVMGKTHDHRFDDLMDKIRHWLGECEEMLERRPVSNRTDSELIEKLRIVLSRIDCGPQKSPREQYTHWGAAIFCAHTPLVDVRATCPVWYGKAVRRKNAAGAITNRYRDCRKTRGTRQSDDDPEALSARPQLTKKSRCGGNPRTAICGKKYVAVREYSRKHQAIT